MNLGFTKSKKDYSLCFKDEGRRPVILLLYVDDLFLTGKEELIKIFKKETCCRVQDEEIQYDELPSSHGGVEECG